MNDAPLRVLHLTAGSDAGGVSRYLFNLCRAMHERGHDVCVAGQRGAWHHLFEGAAFPWLEVPLKGGWAALRRSFAPLAEHVEAHRVDVVHAHYRKAALVARRLARRLGVPLLFTLHVTGIPIHGVWRWFSDFGDHAHAPSLMARQWLIDQGRVSADRITVIPHGIDPDAFPLSDAADQARARAALNVPAGAVVAAYVGRFDVPKNESWLIDLAAAGRTRVPPIHVLMLGEGPHEASLRARVEAEGLEGRVRVLPYGDPLPVYQAADAVLLPSAQEGFSFVTTEAMSAGRPVLRTRTAGAAEHIVEGVTGRSVPVDRQMYLEAALAFLADRTALSAMGQAAAHHVRDHLTFARQMADTLGLYRRLADQRAARNQ